MQAVIELVAKTLETLDRVRGLEGEISAAFNAAGEEDWPGDHALLDQAQRALNLGHQPYFDAVDKLQQFIGSAEVERAGLGVP